MTFGKYSAFLLQSGTHHDPDRHHLFIACTNPDAAGKLLIIPINTYKNSRCDNSCILYPYEHSWLTKKSFVNYNRARIVSTEFLEANVQTSKIKDNMNRQTFLKLVKGISVSRGAKSKIKKYYHENKSN